MDIFTQKTLETLNEFKGINEGYSLEISKDGKNIIRINKDNKKNYIGSKYNVKKDINEFLKDLEDMDPSTIFVIFGLGSGEHIRELMKKLEDNNKVLIIEPDINTAIEFLKAEYAEEIINDVRISLNIYEEDKIECFLENTIDSLTIRNKINFSIFANYHKIYRNEFLFTFNIFKKVIENSLMNNSTIKHFSEISAKAFLKNLKHIEKATPINYFKNRFENKPAIVVSAGPSLGKNISELKDAQDKFIIITGARSLGELIENDIFPDFVCMVDPGDINIKFIEKYLEYKIPLLFVEQTSYKAMELYKGPKILFSANPITSSMLNLDIDNLVSGGSVAHICTSFAGYMGCTPITFIGQDFAYTNNKFHSELIAFKENNKIESDDGFIDVEDIFGNMVKTNWTLNNFKNNMEWIIKDYKEKVFIDSTEGGAKIKGTIIQPLKNTILEHSMQGIGKEKIKDILNHIPLIERKETIKYLEESEKVLINIQKKANIALGYSSNLYLAYTQGKSVNNINKKLNEIDNYIKENREKIFLINSILFEVIENTLSNRDYILSSKDSEVEKGIKVSEKSRYLYKGIKDKIEYFLPILRKEIKVLKEEKI
ncbi:DUF115 domain-containing protein [Clostridium tetani]|uniref:motility associated factor glycosyltransferase family protein n=1 Tax=Clostridium tetani TaxID=1513 RepID=UPI00100A3CF5|nr:6-hydroxymethylpterin diphosphokinase MptE-like protein [Clostridium tetani]RXI45889.1 DUF115 domain-containing protein [Clostridium tetani]RXM61281.1 DUF115 domain-containing protein [Clostridium tetani]RXM70106.1 DUF115 domain-containing protein [Clostridium tetani]